MSGFREPETSREQMVLWSRRLDDALPVDHPVRQVEELLHSEAFRDTFREWERLAVLRTSQDQQKSGVVIRRQYGGCAECARCAKASTCCKDPKKGRTVNRDQYEERRERLRVRMDTDIGRARYKLRRQTVEPRFGLMKHNWGIRRFLRRGLESVHTEWVLICTAVNLGILPKHWEVVKAMG